MVDLKKQSQFAGRAYGANSYFRRTYGDIPPFGARKNKPNQSQFHAEASPKGSKQTSEVSGRLPDFGYLPSVFSHLAQQQLPACRPKQLFHLIMGSKTGSNDDIYMFTNMIARSNIGILI